MANISTIVGNVLADSGISSTSLAIASGTASQLLAGNGSFISAGTGITISAGTISASGGSGSGSVTSVDMSVPTGFSITGNPITTAGTLAISFASGYSLPTTASQTNWDTAYGWGNHATAGYLPSANPNFTGVLNTGTLTYTPANHLMSLQSSVNSYNQIVFQNSNSGASASSDFVVNNNLSTDTTYYGDFGINSSTFSGTGSLTLPNATYLTATSGDLALGTTTSNAIHFVTNSGSTDAATIFSNGNFGINVTSDGGYKLDIGGSARVQSGLILGANTATIAPLDFTPTSAVLKTTSAAGDMEVDSNGLLYYSHNASNRGVVSAEQFISLTSTYTLTSQTGAQKLFNSTTNGALTLKGSTSYFFECFYTLTSMSGTSGNGGFSVLGAGTATITSAAFWAQGLDSTTLTTGANIGGSFTASATTTNNLVTAATGTSVAVLIRGIIRINAGGTIIPSVSLTTAAAAVVGVNSYFRIYPIGTNTTTNVGNWS